MEPGFLWIAGEWRPASSGATFASADGENWSQASEPDLRAALDAALAVASDWRATDERDRRRHVERMAAALEEDERLLDGLERHLGLSAGELELQRRGIGGTLGGASDASFAAGPVALVVPDWRELARGAFRDLARELVAARPTVLVSDPRVPELAAGVARAALAAELPRGVVNVLHGRPRELVAQALTATNGGLELVASGSGERIVELRRLCEAAGGSEGRLTTLRAGVIEVEDGGSLADAASEVVERAFGRRATLGGQLPGSIARVLCPARLFSRFSELTMAALEASLPVTKPLLLIDREAAEAARTAAALGLDEGATLIAGGEELTGAEGERAVTPTVLTNVEPFMSSARRQEPLPVLCLMRQG